MKLEEEEEEEEASMAPKYISSQFVSIPLPHLFLAIVGVVAVAATAFTAGSAWRGGCFFERHQPYDVHINGSDPRFAARFGSSSTSSITKVPAPAQQSTVLRYANMSEHPACVFFRSGEWWSTRTRGADSCYHVQSTVGTIVYHHPGSTRHVSGNCQQLLAYASNCQMQQQRQLHRQQQQQQQMDAAMPHKCQAGVATVVCETLSR